MYKLTKPTIYLAIFLIFIDMILLCINTNNSIAAAFNGFSSGVWFTLFIDSALNYWYRDRD